MVSFYTKKEDKRPNIFLVISDTLRADFLGCYGDSVTKTPCIDNFAKESILFECAHPESLPTIPVRRALYTGRRSFPFRNYKALKWDNVYLPGWQPISNEESTIAEDFVEAGYYTGFVSDVPHYFVPGMNFTRGFWQWEFVRGQAEDKWRSPAEVDLEQLSRYKESKGDSEKLLSYFPRGYALRHLANFSVVRHEEDTTTARVFRWAMDFVESNRNIQPLFVVIDCFDPHEAWEAPRPYLEIYTNPEEYKGRTVIHPKYGPIAGVYSKEEVDYIKANYRGLVSLVDTWFGAFVEKLKRTGLWENSVVVFMSDHGTNFADNPEAVLGKPYYSMYPGLMYIPLIIHLPGEEGGKRIKELVFNIDVTATLYEIAGVRPSQRIDGRSLLSLIKGSVPWTRSYLTCRYDEALWYRDLKWWVIMNTQRVPRAVFNLESDPRCMKNVLEENKTVIEMAWEKIVEDAEGSIPTYENIKRTDALGNEVDLEW